MKALIIYDSFFGNTEKVAFAICDVLGKDAQAIRVNEATQEMLKGIELLIVGSPTRGFRPTPAIDTFLKNIPKKSLEKVKAAAFDTRLCQEDISMKLLSFFVKTFGYADKSMTKELKRTGATVMESEGFCVKDTKGPLKDGELERAKDWTKRMIESQ